MIIETDIDPRIAALNAHYKGLYLPPGRLRTVLKPDSPWKFQKPSPTAPHAPYFFLRNQWCKVAFTPIDGPETTFAEEFDEPSERKVSPYVFVAETAREYGALLCEGKLVVVTEAI